MCPPAQYQPKNCRTCCCKSSDNVDFYHPETAYQPECGATDNAEYKISVIPTISPLCHYDVDFPISGGLAYFTDPKMTSHHGEQHYTKIVDAEFLNFTDAYNVWLEFHFESEVEQGIIHDFSVPCVGLDCPEDSKRSVGYLDLSPYSRYISMISKLVIFSCTFACVYYSLIQTPLCQDNFTVVTFLVDFR